MVISGIPGASPGAIELYMKLRRDATVIWGNTRLALQQLGLDVSKGFQADASIEDLRAAIFIWEFPKTRDPNTVS